MTIHTVEIPVSSSVRAISPTDCWQIGQQVTKKATSAPAAFNWLASAGAVSCSSCIGWGKIPEKLIAGSTSRPICPLAASS